MAEKNDLKNSDLEKVTGGVEYQGQEEKYCKYCGKNTKQSLRKGVELGWDIRGKQHSCNLYDCSECYNTNYYDCHTGELI